MAGQYLNQATEAAALAGTNNQDFMTSLRTKESIANRLSVQPEELRNVSYAVEGSIRVIEFFDGYFLGRQYIHICNQQVAHGSRRLDHSTINRKQWYSQNVAVQRWRSADRHRCSVI
jgi:hypothetical protein